MEARGTARDYGWFALAAIMGVLTVVNLTACAVSVFRGDVLGLVRAPFSVLFGYWMGVGAWRRTRWGLVTVDASQVLPASEARRIRRLVLLAVACSVAFTFALAVQTVIGRS